MATIQIRKIPDDVHRVYQLRAAAAGQSLQEYLRGELISNARTAAPAEIVAEVESRLLETLPSLRAARVTRSLPADCAITVAEREPFLAWRWGDALVWVDQDGVVYSARNGVQDVLSIESSDVQPPPPGQRVDSDLMAAIVAAAQALPEVRMLRVSVARGLEFTDASGYPVYLGTGYNMADRAVVWRALREDLASRGIEPLYIDVRFPLAPYYGRP